jgi:hypothetical protein
MIVDTGINLFPDAFQQPFHRLFMALKMNGMFISPFGGQEIIQLENIVVDVA